MDYDKNDGIIAGYECGYCDYYFEHRARTGRSSDSIVSNTITCPNCKNNLQTWKDIKEVLKTNKNKFGF